MIVIATISEAAATSDDHPATTSCATAQEPSRWPTKPISVDFRRADPRKDACPVCVVSRGGNMTCLPSVAERYIHPGKLFVAQSLRSRVTSIMFSVSSPTLYQSTCPLWRTTLTSVYKSLSHFLVTPRTTGEQVPSTKRKESSVRFAQQHNIQST